MIARVWIVKTEVEQSEEYERIIAERDIPVYKYTKGFVKLTFLKRADSQFVYFSLITFWEGIEVVKNFTGEHFEKAVSYEEDQEFLVDFPGSVLHYEVFSN